MRPEESQPEVFERRKIQGHLSQRRRQQNERQCPDDAADRREPHADPERQFRLTLERHRVGFVRISSRRWRFVSRQIEGNYPDWRVPIPNPNDAKTHLTIDPAKLETLTKLIQRMPCHDVERHHTIGLEWKEGTLRLLGKENPEDEWIRVPVQDFKGDGPDITIFADRRYLIKAFGFGLNVISLIDPMSPLRFHHGGKTLIVMPLRCTADPAVNTAATPPTSPPPAEKPQAPITMQTQTHGQTRPIGANGSTPQAAPAVSKEETKSALETALVQIESIKAGFRETINGLSKLGDSIRNAMREQKASEKEVHTVRQTLRSLQSVRI